MVVVVVTLYSLPVAVDLVHLLHCVLAHCVEVNITLHCQTEVYWLEIVQSDPALLTLTQSRPHLVPRQQSRVLLLVGILTERTGPGTSPVGRVHGSEPFVAPPADCWVLLWVKSGNRESEIRSQSLTNWAVDCGRSVRSLLFPLLVIRLCPDITVLWSPICFLSVES